MLHTLLSVTKVMRIKEWRAYLALSLYGVVLSSNNLTYLLIRSLEIIVLLFPYMSSAYIANNIFDVNGDSINTNKRSRNPLSTRELSLKTALRVLYIMTGFEAFLGICLLFYSDLLASFLYLGGAILSLIYSIPPIRLKERPPLDILSHSIFFGISPFLVGFFLSIRSDIVSTSWLATLSALIAVYSAILELRNEIEDYEFDKRVGYRTSATKLGYGNSLRLLKVLFLSFALLTIFFIIKFIKFYNYFILIPSIILLFIFIYKLKIRFMDIYAILFFLLTLLWRYLQ